MFHVKHIMSPLALALALAGCAATPVTAPPRVVTVTRIQYAPLPAADLLPCLPPAGPLETNADLWMAYQATRVALSVCNGQIHDLERLSGTPPPSSH